MPVVPAGSSSTLLFRELVSKLQIGSLQDQIFSLRGLNSIVQVNEHTSIMLLKTQDFARIIFSLCKTKAGKARGGVERESGNERQMAQLRVQALKFLRHLASGSVCRKLLISQGALDQFVDLVIEDFGNHSEEFLVVASEYLLQLLNYNPDLKAHKVSERTKEKLSRTVNYLQDSSFHAVRYTMSKLSGGGGGGGTGTPGLYDRSTQKQTSTTYGGRNEKLLDFGGRNVLRSSSRENTQKALTKYEKEEVSFNQRLMHLKSSISSTHAKPSPRSSKSTDAAGGVAFHHEGQVAMEVVSGGEGDESLVEVEVAEMKKGDTLEHSMSMASLSSDTDSSPSVSENDGDRAGREVEADNKTAESEEEEEEEEEEEPSPSPPKLVQETSSTSSTSGTEDDDHGETMNERDDITNGRHSVNPLQIKRGALLYKHFNLWMQVAENELLMRQKARNLRRIFLQNNKNRRVCETFYAWKFNIRQKMLLALCLNKWVGLRLGIVLQAWEMAVKERRRNQRLCLRYSERRLYNLVLDVFAEWRGLVNRRVFTTFREMRAKCLYLEDEVDDLREAKTEAIAFKDNLYNVLSEVAEIGVNLLKVENGGTALIDCCARVENILRLNSAYVPQEALDSALASIDWSNLPSEKEESMEQQSSARKPV